jgi:putative flavoprotein involved in K+ transport
MPNCPRTGARGLLEPHRFADGSELDFDAVIWATGYRSDYSWIQVPVFDDHTAPIHRRGVAAAPGLYFLGMKNQYSRGSALIHWVKDDAGYIVDHLRHAPAARA